MGAVSESIPVEIWEATPWLGRSLACKAGFHTYGAVTEFDIASATMVCERCSKVWHFSGELLIECIKRRARLAMRVNHGDRLHRKYFCAPAEERGRTGASLSPGMKTHSTRKHR